VSVDFTAPSYVELAEIGVVQLTRTGRIIKVRVMDAPDDTGPVVDLREFMTEDFWTRLNAAHAKAALTGRKLNGPMPAQQYTGPLRRGWWLQPSAAEQLADLLGRAVVEAWTLAERRDAEVSTAG
jgi:hypothetical protein